MTKKWAALIIGTVLVAALAGVAAVAFFPTKQTSHLCAGVGLLEGDSFHSKEKAEKILKKRYPNLDGFDLTQNPDGTWTATGACVVDY